MTNWDLFVGLIVTYGKITADRVCVCVYFVQQRSKGAYFYPLRTNCSIRYIYIYIFFFFTGSASIYNYIYIYIGDPVKNKKLMRLCKGIICDE